MDLSLDLQESYRVEVSGWDDSENFFVEKTVLDWGSEDRKEVVLRSPLREGCVVFMRLLQPLNNANSVPLAYQAVRIRSKDSTGRMRVSLAQLRPRASHRELAALENPASFPVA